MLELEAISASLRLQLQSLQSVANSDQVKYLIDFGLNAVMKTCLQAMESQRLEWESKLKQAQVHCYISIVPS